MSRNLKCYNVWVGGVKVNDYRLTPAEAEELAQEYKDDGYDYVIVDKY